MSVEEARRTVFERSHREALKELDRLRAENERLRAGVQLAIDADMSYIDDEAVRQELRAILTSTTASADSAADPE